jgi:Kdo2-lipid IVA lauroyltransferase/acyltransferase
MRAGSVGKAISAIVARIVLWSFKAVQWLDYGRMANFAGRTMRRIGPRLKEHSLGRANIAAAFPEKSSEEVEAILAGVWDNLGRVAVEFAYLNRLHILDPARPGSENILYEPEVHDRFHRLRLDRKPSLVFAAHLANWELPAYVAASYGLRVTTLYRRLNIKAVNDAILRTRSEIMGTLVATGHGAPMKLLRALQEGQHVAMLIDQHLAQGVDVTFFGRPCKANPLIAQLARNLECPIYGTRVVRLPDRNRFRVDLTEAVEPARDQEGQIDVRTTMQRVTDVVEGWVREHPDQWLWLHNRWR